MGFGVGMVGDALDIAKTAAQTIQNPESSMLDEGAMAESKAKREEAQKKAQAGSASRNLMSIASASGTLNNTKAMSSKKFYNQVKGTMETVGSTISGAASGGWVGAVLGFVKGASKQVIGGIQAKKYAKKEKERLEKMKKRENQALNSAEAETSKDILRSSTVVFKYGGKKHNKYNTFMSDYSNGVNFFGTGGSHEENPYEGIQVGIDPQGTPNMVEEGESIFGDFVFSERLHPSFAERKQLTKELSLSKSVIKGKSYSDLAMYLSRESKERPNDPISKAALNKALDRLASSQERCKEAKRQTEMLEMFELAPTSEKAKILDLAAQQYNAQQQQAAQEQAVQEQMAREQQMQQMQQAQQQGGMSPEQQQQMIQQMQMQGEGLQQAYAYGGEVNKYGFGSLLSSIGGSIGGALTSMGKSGTTQGGQGAKANSGMMGLFDVAKNAITSIGSAKSGAAGAAAGDSGGGGIGDMLGGLFNKAVKGIKSRKAEATDTEGNPIAASTGLQTASLNFDGIGGAGGANSSACGGRINRYDNGTIDLSKMSQADYDALSNEDYAKLLKQFEYEGKNKVRPYAGSNMRNNGNLTDFSGFNKEKDRYTLDYLKRVQKLQNNQDYFNQFMSSGAFESFGKENKELWDNMSTQDRMKLAASLASDYRGISTPFAYSDFHKMLENPNIYANRGFTITTDENGKEVVVPVADFDLNKGVAGYNLSRANQTTEDGINYNDYYYSQPSVTKSETPPATSTEVVPEESEATEEPEEEVIRGGNRPKALSTVGRYAPAAASAAMLLANKNDDFTTSLDNRAYRLAQFQPIQGQYTPNLINPDWVRQEENKRNAQMMSLAAQGNINPMMRAQMLSGLMEQGQRSAQNAVLEAYKHNNAELQKQAEFNLDRDKFNAQGLYDASKTNTQINELDLARDKAIAAQKLQQSENYKDRQDAYVSSLANSLADIAKENFHINQWNANEGVNKGYYIGKDGSIVGAEGEAVSGEASEAGSRKEARAAKRAAKKEERRLKREGIPFEEKETFISTPETTDMTSSEKAENKRISKLAKSYNKANPNDITFTVKDKDGNDMQINSDELALAAAKSPGYKGGMSREQVMKLDDEQLGQLYEDGAIDEQTMAAVQAKRQMFLDENNQEFTKQIKGHKGERSDAKTREVLPSEIEAENKKHNAKYQKLFEEPYGQNFIKGEDLKTFETQLENARKTQAGREAGLQILEEMKQAGQLSSSDYAKYQKLLSQTDKYAEEVKKGKMTPAMARVLGGLDLSSIVINKRQNIKKKEETSTPAKTNTLGGLDISSIANKKQQKTKKKK